MEIKVIDLLTNKPVKSVEVYLETHTEKTIFGVSEKVVLKTFKLSKLTRLSHFLTISMLSHFLEVLLQKLEKQLFST